ncbi:hypothetical protein B0H13DRAFT_1853746 [Mycena leptocephala]|nr:hypothetical protein B0H13DRAFT_1853746 [Mycena leptocephala]
MSDSPEAVVTHPVAPWQKEPHAGPNLAAYQAAHEETVGAGSDEWWAAKAREMLHWDTAERRVHGGGYCVVSRERAECGVQLCRLRILTGPDLAQVAIIYEADEPGEGCSITYAELLRKVCSLANVLTSTFGVKLSRRATPYCPPQIMAAEDLFFILYVRLPLLFPSLLSPSLRMRIWINADPTQSSGWPTSPTASIVHHGHGRLHILQPLLTGIGVSTVIHIREHPRLPLPRYWETVAKHKGPAGRGETFFRYLPSCSTGPHSFLREEGGEEGGFAQFPFLDFGFLGGREAFACLSCWWRAGGEDFRGPSDCGPAVLRTSSFGFGIPLRSSSSASPSASSSAAAPVQRKEAGWRGARNWEWGDEEALYLPPISLSPPAYGNGSHDSAHTTCPTRPLFAPRSSLHVLGSVGEPITPRRGTGATSMQTETGSIITPFPGAVPTTLGSATVPFFGRVPAILDPISVEKLHGNCAVGVLVLAMPRPSIARTIWQDHARYLETYPGLRREIMRTGIFGLRGGLMVGVLLFVKETQGVGALRTTTMPSPFSTSLVLALPDDYELTRLSFFQTTYPAIDSPPPRARSSLIETTADELTGQAVYAFVTLKPELTYDTTSKAALAKELVLQVRKVIGPFAAPKKIYAVPDLPKTRSGKIMRCILRKIVAGEGE